MTDQEKIRRIGLELGGGSIRKNYSGRGMFGRNCMGVVVDDKTDAIMMAGSLGLPKPMTDNMGRSYIVYWPSIQAEPDKDENDE